MSPAVDQATRTFPVEILVDNSDLSLKPGFFTKGTIFTKKDENVMAVPDAAVSTLAGESSVYVIENDVIRKQSVSLGARVDGNIEITNGLKGAEILATTQLSELATGVPVTTGRGGSGPPDEGGQGRRGRPGRGGRI